jgi:hypothetical protein
MGRYRPRTPSVEQLDAFSECLPVEINLQHPASDGSLIILKLLIRCKSMAECSLLRGQLEHTWGPALLTSFIASHISHPDDSLSFSSTNRLLPPLFITTR